MAEGEGVAIAPIEISKKVDGTIIGEVVIGKVNPRSLTEQQFAASKELLYHGTAREFVYSPTGNYDTRATGGDGTTDYGFGFYTTGSPKQAKNYSSERSKGRLNVPIVYSFLPYQAKMLDVRDAVKPTLNGILPRSFVEQWVKYLEEYLNDEKNFQCFEGLAKEAVYEGVKNDFLERTKLGFQQKILFSIRDPKGRGIFMLDKNGLIDTAFQGFMLFLGYDGMIYREGGEGKDKEDLTGFVFYNPQVIDTWEGWQKRP
ncbi:MAG: DUF3990 domain-containing protein [Patescibacteria group bacterium]|nr:DUF3990 domain-containing protein [Patescibacteria group bacterium]